MSPNVVLAALLAVVCVAAATAAFTLARGNPTGQTRPTSLAPRRHAFDQTIQRASTRFGRRQVITVAAAAAAGLLLALLTGWFVGIVVLPALALLLPFLLTKPDRTGELQLEALADWTRKVAALIASNKPLNEAIKESLRSAPPAIHPQVKLLVTRLNAHQPTVDAVYAFGEELDPRAGPIIGALVLGANAGQAGLTTILSSMAQMFTNEVTQLRKIDKERAEGRNTTRAVTAITAVLLIAICLSPWGEGYRTPLGQGILLILIGMFVGVLWLLQRMEATPPAPRVIIRPGTVRLSQPARPSGTSEMPGSSVASGASGARS